MHRRESILDLYNLVFGLFLFLSPWLFAYVRRTASIDIWISGALIVLFSIAAIIAFSQWDEWINLALGIWLIASPWVLGFTHTKAMHVSIAAGVAVAYLALLELWLVNYEEPHSPDSAPHSPASTNMRS
jgi:hypothetical protein